MNVHSPAMQADLAKYNAAMERSLEDKLFFLDHTAGAMTFVDFGCANGAVLKAVSERRKNKTLIGIDINPMQLAIAGQKVPGGVFAEDFELVRERIAASPGPRVAIFSSVLHESARILEAPMLSGLFDYIIIRDMGITEELSGEKVPEGFLKYFGPGHWNAETTRAKEVFEEHLKTLRAAYDIDGLNGVVETITSNMANLATFLLKYPYLGNSGLQASRELAEDYPLVGFERLLSVQPTTATPYVTTSFEHYSAPWIVDRVRRDFGFEFPFPTHFKMILKKVTL